MGLERVHEILDEIAVNPSRSAVAIEKDINTKKRDNPNRGLNSEIFAKFVLSEIPEVTDIRVVHKIIDNLDCDLTVEFINTRPVNVQVKSSECGEQIFLEKMRRQKAKSRTTLRWVTVNLDNPFDLILKNFVSQVNELDGRESLGNGRLKPRKKERF